MDTRTLRSFTGESAALAQGQAFWFPTLCLETYFYEPPAPDTRVVCVKYVVSPSARDTVEVMATVRTLGSTPAVVLTLRQLALTVPFSKNASIAKL
jgi:hypothetical protein